jgi:hypothetical protein
VTANSGTIEFTTNANQNGQFFTSGPSVLLFDSGKQTFTGASTFNGNGNVKLINVGSFSAPTNVTVAITGPAFELGGQGEMLGPVQPAPPGSYTITRAFTWDGGIIGNANVTVYGHLNITGTPMFLSLNRADLAI